MTLTLNSDITKLNKIQLGAYGEEKAKEIFKINKYNTYTCDSDDHGIDFLAEASDRSIVKIQVKTIRYSKANNLIMILKDKIFPDPDMYVFVLLLDIDNNTRHYYLIPAVDIVNTIDKNCFKSSDFIGKKSKPEFDITFKKNYVNDFSRYEIK